MLVTYRPRAWHLALVALIAILDAGALYMVLRPNVAADYRAYYIDRSSSCFPRLITGYYPLGEPISFVAGRNGYKLDTTRWCGFQPPSPTGIRSFGDYGILRLKFPVPNENLVLQTTAWANTDASKPVREVKVVVNGQQVGTMTFNSAAKINGRYAIPQMIAKGGAPEGMEIKFIVPRTGLPGTNSEPQTLQLRIEALRVAPLSQVQRETAVTGLETKKAGLPPPSLSSGRRPL